MRRGSECVQGVQGVQGTGSDAVSVCRSKESWLPGPYPGIAGTGRQWHAQVNAVRAGVVMGVCTTGVEPEALASRGKSNRRFEQEQSWCSPHHRDEVSAKRLTDANELSTLRVMAATKQRLR